MVKISGLEFQAIVLEQTPLSLQKTNMLTCLPLLRSNGDYQDKSINEENPTNRKLTQKDVKIIHLT